jgi:hypothetical protein
MMEDNGTELVLNNVCLCGCVQVLVHGFAFNGPGSYLRNPWNVLDFVIVVIGKAQSVTSSA